MSCRQFDLGADSAERGDRDAAHLLRCRPCRADYDGYRAVGALLGELPEGGESRTWESLRSSTASSVARPRRSAVRAARVVAAAYVAAAAAFLLVWSVGVAQGDVGEQDYQHALEQVDIEVERRVRAIEVSRAEDDIHYQLVHVAVAAERANSPGAGIAEHELIAARLAALEQLRERHRAVLLAAAQVPSRNNSL